jgi:ribosomal protein L11 methyltransferase
MSWTQITFETSSERVPALSELLDELGAQAVTLQDAGDQPIFEPPPGETPLWQATQIVALFGPDTDTSSVLDRLQGCVAPGPLPPHRVEQLADQAWERVCMDEFRPMPFGRRLWVCPSWSDAPAPPAVTVSLDPGLAFGTGSHPTTALCLAWLDGASVEGAQIVDYGCGSGILAIAALRLGARRAWAVDTDPQAWAATLENAGKNGVAERLHVCAPSELPLIEADILVANILARPLIELAPSLAAHVRVGGAIALSGILEEQASTIAAAYQPWFVTDAPALRDKWIRITGRRKPERSF